MDQRPRRSVFERLGRLPREYSNNSGLGNSGPSQALLPGPPPLLRYPERSNHELNHFQRNPRRRPPNNYDDHYNGPVKKSRLDIGIEKPPAPLLQLRQMPPILSQPEKKIKLRRRKPRPVDETLDEGEIVDDDDEYEEYSEEEEDDKVKGDGKTNTQIHVERTTNERRNLSLKELDTLSLKSFDSSSDKNQPKTNTPSKGASTNVVKTTLESDKGSNYSDWSDDELLLRDDAQKDDNEEGKSDKKAHEDNADCDADSFAFQNSGKFPFFLFFSLPIFPLFAFSSTLYYSSLFFLLFGLLF